jgi:hypothetical protein
MSFGLRFLGLPFCLGAGGIFGFAPLCGPKYPLSRFVSSRSPGLEGALGESQ